jgi:hypothetical protein
VTDKLDINAFSTPSARAAQSGVGMSRTMLIVNKINEIIDALGTPASVSAIDTLNKQIAALTDRVATLEKQPQAAIPDVSESAITISATNLLNISVLSTNSTSQAKTINKLLAVMRARGEIST